MMHLLSFAQKDHSTIFNEVIVIPDRTFNIKNFYLNNVTVESISTSMNIYLLKCSNDNTAKALIEKYHSDPQIKAIQYNHRFEYRSYTPVDSYYTNQWFLNNTGQYGYTVGVDIDAPQAWDSSLTNLTRYGDTIVVAVPDVKFDLNHQDINYFKNYHEIPLNGIDDDGNGYIDDYNGWNALLNNDDVNLNTGGHATQLAGIIGAKHNYYGVAGICNGVKILPIYTQAIESQAIESYAYIVDMRRLYDLTNGAKGAYIVASNTSFGIDNEFAVDFPIWCAMYDSMGKYGILSAAATANKYQDVDALGDMPTTCLSHFLIAVTNNTGTNNLSITAAYGDSSIDLSAPGTNILSCIGPNAYAGGNGTSYASPQVAGAIAFLMSYACPKFLDLYASFPDSAMLIMKKCILDGTVAVPDLVGKSVTGGRLNLYNALTQLNNQFDCTDCNGSVNVSLQNVLCNGDSTGALSITITPPNANLNYVWSNGLNTSTINHLTAGNYRVTITDSIGCERVKTFNITESDELYFDSISALPYYTTTNGSIYMRGNGGKAPYQYSINGTDYYNITNFIGLSAGVYTAYIKDLNGCIVTQNITIEDHTGINNPFIQNHVELLNNNSNSTIQYTIKNQFSTNLKLEILDIQGKKILNEQRTLLPNLTFTEKIDISSLSNGIYLLSFYGENSLIKTFKIVKY